MDEEAFLRCYGFPTIPWAPAYMGEPADMAVKPPKAKAVAEGVRNVRE